MLLPFALALAALPARAAECPSHASQQPCGQQLWMISTREAPRCGDLEAGLSRVTYSRLDDSAGCSSWAPSDRAAFCASGNSSIPTTILVHGNSTDTDWAVRHGWTLWCLMRNSACGRPFRLVVWSWPADKVSARPRPDVQVKMQWSDTESYYLARLMPDVPAGTPLGLVGFSLGCRSLGGALAMLAGGDAAGRRLPPETIAAWTQGPPRPIRLAYVAAAVDSDWLESCRPEGLASLAVERILVTRNCGDRVLKFYSRTYGRRGPEAMGYAGPAGCDGGKLEVIDLGCEVARHDYDLYFAAPSLVGRLPWYTFLAER